MRHRARTVLTIAVVAALSGCGKPAGEQLLGKWVNEKNKETIEITKNGDGFLFKDTLVRPFIGAMVNKFPATYEKGTLQVGTGMGTMNVGYDRDRDVLLVPAMGGTVELTRVK